MKILLVNTSGKTGGAAIAASRLMTTLNRNGVDATMLVADGETRRNGAVASLPCRLRHKWNFLSERLLLYVSQNFSRKHLFDIDPAMTGTDITRLPEFSEADVIHLHWVNQGFLSLRDIRHILESGKPVVWTMHDMWPFTGVCHYVHSCDHYKRQCGSCPLLAHRGPRDLSHRIWKRKQAVWSRFPRLTFVACSKWLAQTAAGSPLVGGHKVLNIVNPIDCELYSPRNKAEARQALGLSAGNKKLILFCAYNVMLPIKGLAYLKEALEMLVSISPELKEQLGVVMVGKGSETAGVDFPVETFPMGFVTDEHRKATIYNACDVFAIPSLQDNLPNTIVEAKASGLPVIGTKVGGIPQMIEHGVDGCLVAPQDSAELAEALKWMLSEANLDRMSEQSRLDAQKQYSEQTVAKRYMECYRSLMDEHRQSFTEKQ